MTLPFDTSKLPTVPPHTGWVVLRSGSLIEGLDQDDDGGFYLNDWDFYWTSDGKAFDYNGHGHAPSLDVICVISGEDMRAFLDSQIGAAQK